MVAFFKIVGIVLVAFLLASCGSSRAAKEAAAQRASAKQAYDAEKLQCEKDYVAGRVKTIVDAIRCKNNARTKWWIASGFPNHDLITLANARYLENAERYQKKRITLAQFRAREAEIASDMISVMSKRVNDERMANAAEDQAYAAHRQARAAAQQADASERQARASDRQADAADRRAEPARPVIGGIAQEPFRAPRGYRY